MRGVASVPWTEEERQQLRRLHENGLSQAQICLLLGRSKHSVHRQVTYLALVRSGSGPTSTVKKGTGGGGHHVVPKTTLPPLPSLRDG